MSAHARSYHLAEEAAQRRLEELSDVDAENISDVAGELGLARLLAERCALTNPGLCNAILGNIAKLSVAAQRHAIATNELLSRPALFAFTREIIAVVCEEVRRLPDSDAIIDAIARRLDAAMAKVKNEPDQTPRLLTHERLP
jgi:GMP synthase PP-ATPase subunit